MSSRTSELTTGPADPVALRSVELDVAGMTCASCAARIEKSLNRLDGVSASVNYATERATVHAPTAVEVAKLIATIERTGYAASVPLPQGPEPADELRRLRQRTLVAVVLAVPVVVLGMVPTVASAGTAWLSLLLTLAVVGWAGWPFHRAALVNLRHGSTTMDTLVSLGTLAATVWSAYALLAGTGHLYLEVAAGVTALVLLGRYLEARAKRRAGAAFALCSSSRRPRRRCFRTGPSTGYPRAHCAPVTASWSCRARPSPPTVSWPPATVPPTPRWSPVSRCRWSWASATPWSVVA